MCQLKSFLEQEAFFMITYALNNSCLDYDNAKQPLHTNWKLQLAQHVVTK